MSRSSVFSKSGSRFYPIDLRALRLEARIDFDVYLDVKGDMVLYRSRDLVFDINTLTAQSGAVRRPRLTSLDWTVQERPPVRRDGGESPDLFTGWLVKPPGPRLKTRKASLSSSRVDATPAG